MTGKELCGKWLAPVVHAFYRLYCIGPAIELESPNEPPVADAGEDQTVPCTDHHGALVTLDARGSSDPNEDALQYEWSAAEEAGIVIFDPEAMITDAHFPLGTHEVTLTVYDLDSQGERRGTLDVATVQITVFDEHPPIVSVTTDLAALWPANNQLTDVQLSITATDHCTAPEALLVYCTITSSQPDDSDGSGQHTGDVAGSDGFTAAVEIDLSSDAQGNYWATVPLRAERDGNDRSGRVYSIQVWALDLSGNIGQHTCTVVVPHNRGKGK